MVGDLAALHPRLRPQRLLAVSRQPPLRHVHPPLPQRHPPPGSSPSLLAPSRLPSHFSTSTAPFLLFLSRPRLLPPFKLPVVVPFAYSIMACTSNIFCPQSSGRHHVITEGAKGNCSRVNFPEQQEQLALLGTCVTFLRYRFRGATDHNCSGVNFLEQHERMVSRRACARCQGNIEGARDHNCPGVISQEQQEQLGSLRGFGFLHLHCLAKWRLPPSTVGLTSPVTRALPCSWTSQLPACRGCLPHGPCLPSS